MPSVTIGSYTPPPVVDREALAQRIQRAWRLASELTATTASAKADAMHIKGVMIAGATNDVANLLAALLESAADDREFEVPMQRLADLESGLAALGYE